MKVEADARSLIVDGKRTLLLSGAVHYTRSPPEQWPELMRLTRAAGLNCVETYVFWGRHERTRGEYDFTGRLDLKGFCAAAAAEGLMVFLRPGPYICAEVNYGGFPAWLRDVPGIRFRTENAPFYAAVEAWFTTLFAYVSPLLGTAGGPIVALQVENEFANIAASYGAAGTAYLEWLRDLMARLAPGMLLTSCNPAGDAAAMAKRNALPGTVPTLNSGFAHPFVRPFREWAPEAPCWWTEAWMSWYQIWGAPRPWRPASNCAYCVARFFAEGGKGINYYMWHGGTNFGREGMFLQATSYDYDAPLDEYGRPTYKYRILAELHRCLNEQAEFLVETDLPECETRADGSEVRRFRRGSRELRFICDDGPAQSVAIQLAGRTIWSTKADSRRDPPEFAWTAAPGIAASDWETRAEMPPQRQGELLARPTEQLRFTRDATDYAWYHTELALGAAAGPGKLIFRGINDFFQIFLDGIRVDQSRERLAEDRGAWDSDDYQAAFELILPSESCRLAVLVCALGLIKGDWQAGRANMVEERKGFWGRAVWHPTDSGQPVELGPWRIHAGLVSGGDRQPARVAPPDGWAALEEAGVGNPLLWYRQEFYAPDRTDLPLALDLTGMGKGLVWINGHCLGRYWLISSRVPETAHQEHNQVMHFDETETATQRRYQIPRAWLRGGKNQLLMFEETGGDPRGVGLAIRT